MGYSDSLETVENRKELLGAMMEGEPMIWDCQPGSEKIIAYQVRECQHIARNNPDMFPGLYKAASFEIAILEKGVVAARPKKAVIAGAVGRQIVGDTMTPEKKLKKKDPP